MGCALVPQTALAVTSAFARGRGHPEAHRFVALCAPGAPGCRLPGAAPAQVWGQSTDIARPEAGGVRLGGPRHQQRLTALGSRQASGHRPARAESAPRPTCPCARLLGAKGWGILGAFGCWANHMKALGRGAPINSAIAGWRLLGITQPTCKRRRAHQPCLRSWRMHCRCWTRWRSYCWIGTTSARPARRRSLRVSPSSFRFVAG